MRSRLFGKNITPDCSYCENSFVESGVTSCKKYKTLTDGKCRSFKYDPLMRIPRTVTLRGNYTAEDFKL